MRILLYFAVACVAAVTATAQINVTCVGDSITFGAAIKDRGTNSYPAQLQKMLGDGYKVHNFGVNGATLLKKGDKPYWKLGAYQNALKSNPQIVVIKLGTNDTKPQNWKHKAEYEADYKALIESFQALPSKPRVIIMFPVPVAKDRWGINEKAVKGQAIPTLRKVSLATGCEIIDLHTAMMSHHDLMPDGVHPNGKGATILANRVHDTITRKNDADFDIKQTLGVATKDANFHGYRMLTFNHNGRGCKIVQPKVTAEGRPWVWRARFFGHEPQGDLALLERGFHVVYSDVGNLFGNAKAVESWNGFYALMQKAGLEKKCSLIGMSRGGLIIYNWASKNPEKVYGIYGDAPVCDIKSWPGGKGKGKGSAGTWKQCLKAYGFTEEQAMAFKGNPIDNLEPIAKAKIPLFHIVGEADDVVPVAENTNILEERYKTLGGSIEVIRKDGVGHHPHSVKDPQPIVEYVLKVSGR
jgi:lysophospholipase L1-like esterase/pimeloyl-ACP methyl ester carboxylesterase